MKKLIKKFHFCLIATLILTSFTMIPVFAADTVAAAPTSSAVLVNGSGVAFQAYNINGYNYFKLRDLGKALSGSDKQFDVGYDSASKAVTITTGYAYTPVSGDQSAASGSASAAATPSKSDVLINGMKADLTAYLINGNNYFKLRDVAAAINFSVTFKNGVINIDTAKGYTAESATPANPLVGAWYYDFDSDEDITFVIFTEDGTMSAFLGTFVATYTIHGSEMSISDQLSEGSGTYGYSFSSSGGKTVLDIDSAQLGKMEQTGETSSPSADTINGLWLSKSQRYADTEDDTYFYFTKDGKIFIGTALSGAYSISGNILTDNLTDDGSLETTTFERKTVDGEEVLVMTSSDDLEMTFSKE